VAFFAALHEGQPAAEVIDHALEAGRVPPLGGEVVLAAGHHDPEVLRQIRGDAGRAGLFLLGTEVDVAAELGDRDAQLEVLLQVLRVAVQEVVGPLVALVDQRVVHVQYAHTAVIIAKPRQVWVVLPQGRRRGVDVGQESSRRGGVQGANRGRQHQHVAGTLERFQNERLSSFR